MEGRGRVKGVEAKRVEWGQKMSMYVDQTGDTPDPPNSSADATTKRATDAGRQTTDDRRQTTDDESKNSRCFCCC